MEEMTNKAQPKRKPVGARKKLTLIISALVVVIALYFLLPVVFVGFIAHPVKVEGAAMSPTLKNGDRIFITKRLNHLQRGDIVVFYYPEETTKSFIKRIIGLPGEKIDLDSDGNVTINGQSIVENYVQPELNQMSNARWRNVRAEWKQLREDSYFMMGDNRDASNDSRSYGPVSRSLVDGKYLVRYWSSSQ